MLSVKEQELKTLNRNLARLCRIEEERASLERRFIWLMEHENEDERASLERRFIWLMEHENEDEEETLDDDCSSMS